MAAEYRGQFYPADEESHAPRTLSDELALEVSAAALLLSTLAARKLLERIQGSRGTERVGAHVARVGLAVGLLVRLLKTLLVEVVRVGVLVLEEGHCASRKQPSVRGDEHLVNRYYDTDALADENMPESSFDWFEACWTAWSWSRN